MQRCTGVDIYGGMQRCTGVDIYGVCRDIKEYASILGW